MRLGAGLRYVNLKDKFDVIFPGGAAGAQGFFGDSDNHLWGAQLVGGLNILRLNRLSVDITGKIGVYRNEFDLDAVTRTFELHESDDVTSYVSELNVGFEYAITRMFSFRAGYTIFWFDDVIGVAEQSDDFRIATGAGSYDYADPIFQGGYFGWQMRF